MNDLDKIIDPLGMQGRVYPILPKEIDHLLADEMNLLIRSQTFEYYFFYDAMHIKTLGQLIRRK